METVGDDLRTRNRHGAQVHDVESSTDGCGGSRAGAGIRWSSRGGRRSRHVQRIAIYQPDSSRIHRESRSQQVLSCHVHRLNAGCLSTAFRATVQNIRGIVVAAEKGSHRAIEASNRADDIRTLAKRSTGRNVARRHYGHRIRVVAKDQQPVAVVAFRQVMSAGHRNGEGNIPDVQVHYLNRARRLTKNRRIVHSGVSPGCIWRNCNTFRRTRQSNRARGTLSRVVDNGNRVVRGRVR